MKRSRGLAWSLLLCASVSLVAAPAAAQTTTTTYVEDAAEGLQQDAVYVHPEAEFDEADADELRERISEADAGPIYVAILPEEAALEAGGDEGELLRSIGTGVGRAGTYAVVAGDELRAGATETGTPFSPGTVPELANEAVQENSGEGTAAVLFDFVDRLSQEASGGGEEGGSGFGLLPLLLIGGAVGAFMLSRRRGRAR